jgi:hypothetical protein
MKATKVLTVALATLLIPAAAHAVKIPLPIEGATLNLSFQLQTQFLMQENGATNGNDNSYDIFIRRSRLLVNGDINQNFSYLIQFDNPNYGKKGNFNGRGIVQDAWVGWAPTGITGPTVFYIDAGLLLIPFSHNGLESTTNFITADIQTDSLRGLNAGVLTGLRDTGVQVRGWAFNKKVGFRGGVYEGVRAASTAVADAGKPGNQLTPKSNPQFAGFINFDIIGSEEGGWLYGAYKWGKDPILSLGASGLYQSQALRKNGDPTGALGIADQQMVSADMYLNLPMTEAAELVAEATVYFARNGSNSVDTGIGGFGDIGYRFGAIAPYVGYEFFSADSCDGNLTTLQCAPLLGTKNDSRNFKVGLNFFINKNLNHINAEFTVNHGQSKDAFANTTLAASSTKSFLLHWNNIF